MPSRHSSRRDFFKGSPARGRATPQADSDAVAPGVLRLSRAAMAGEFEIFFNTGEYPQATDAALAALDEVDRLEEQLSFYRPTSQVSQINQLAGEMPVTVEESLFELLELAVSLHEQTDGAFDITAGPLCDAWGFSRREGKIPTDAQLEEAMARVGSDKLEHDHENRTVRFRVPGMKINLGAIGKGHALDRCAELLEAEEIENFMIHGGQSSVLARGSMRSAQKDTLGWTVGLHDPTRHGRRLAEICLHDRALGTSGSEKQFFRHQGRRMSHVLDPRTGQPAEGLLSATVLAPNATLADALATALFVLGPERALAFCEAHDELAAALVKTKGNRVEILSSGFEPGELTMC